MPARPVCPKQPPRRSSSPVILDCSNLTNTDNKPTKEMILVALSCEASSPSMGSLHGGPFHSGRRQELGLSIEGQASGTVPLWTQPVFPSSCRRTRGFVCLLGQGPEPSISCLCLPCAEITAVNTKFLLFFKEGFFLPWPS